MKITLNEDLVIGKDVGHTCKKGETFEANEYQGDVIIEPIEGVMIQLSSDINSDVYFPFS